MRGTVSKYIPTIQACSLLCYTIFIAITLSLIPFPVMGEMKTVTHTVKQPFGGSQSPDDARIAAVARAKREALEMAGVYVESFTIVKNSRIDKDEILALTAGVLKAEVVSQKNYHTDDAFGVEVVVRIDVDTSVLEDRVKKLLADRTHLEQLNQARKKEKELLDTVVKLQEENKRLTKSKKSTKKLKEQFKATSQGLTAVEWGDKASALWQDGKYTDPKKAIEYLNNAIRLKPDYARAYNNRGIAYNNLGQYQQAVEDFSTAIRLKPDDADVYSNRGIAYNNLGQHRQTIQDCNQAIRLKPDCANAYVSRGRAYAELGQHQKAIEDCNQAIRLKPDYANAYGNRGAAYAELGQHQKAIEDFNEAIRLKPNFAEAYSNRGMAYLSMGNTTRGCSDAKKACGMGDCNRGLGVRS
ncbi:MAG: tetratricopeptide repeat protein [Proteobacteria bacterium]|nr:tetratricopeptide repeat protein [Pseudomonadota bacterium]